MRQHFKRTHATKTIRELEMVQVLGIFLNKMATLFSILRFLLFIWVVFLQYSACSLPERLRWYKVPTNWERVDLGPSLDTVYLHKSGCCEDRVECIKNGDRIFRSVDSSATFDDPGYNNNRLVHAVLFGDVFSAHHSISVETLSPVFRALATIQKMRYGSDPLLRYPPVPNDCIRVRAWMVYRKKFIVVCRGTNGDQVYIKERWDLENWNFISDCLRENTGHPAMCEDNLIDLLAIQEPNGKTTVVAYIDLVEGMDVNGKRTIYYKVWEGEKYKGSSAKYESRLASIYWYRLDKNIAHGMYFTTDAFVCKFEYELGKADFAIDRFKFDKNQEPKFCRPMAVYLQCPQGWCYELGMTTSFTINGENDFYYVHFTKGLYHWRIKTRRIPMSVPRVEDALYYGSGLQNITTEGKKFREIDASYPPAMIFDATAAFRIEHNNINYTISFHPTNLWTVVPDKNYETRSAGYPVKKTSDNNGRSIKLQLFVPMKPEAAHFDDTERKLYLFQGSQYAVYAVKDETGDIAMSTSWKQVEEPKSVKELKFEEGVEIKEVISLGDNLNFIINATHFYYSVGNIKESDKLLKFSFTELFRVQSECYYNDYREFKKTLGLYGVTLPEETVSQRRYDEKQNLSMETQSNWGTIVIFIIIAFGVAIALVGLLAMFLYGRVKNRTETKVVKKYSTETSGVKERKLSKEPFSRLRTKKKL